MNSYIYSSNVSKVSGIKVFEYVTNTKQQVGKKFLVISDLHALNRFDALGFRAIINELTLKNKKYEAIFLVGDILDSTNILYGNQAIYILLLHFMEFLGSVAPTYVVYASHDLSYYSLDNVKSTGSPWIPDEEMFRKRFLDVVSKFPGFHIIENATEVLGDGYTISTFNPSLEYAMNFPDGISSKSENIASFVSFLDDLSSDDTNLLLCHYPNFILYLFKQGYLKNVDLAIAGHNHNGCTQLKFFPIEFILNFFKQPNRGLITPGKSLSPKDTENLRGVVELNERTNLLINPAIKTLADCSGLEHFDNLYFYKGVTEIEYIPESVMKLTRSK